MKTQKLTYILFIVVALMVSSSVIHAQSEMRWIDFPDSAFEVNGLPWFNENAPDLYRLPKRLSDVVRPPVWSLAKSPSGGRIRFKSNCTSLGIRLEYPRLSGMRNMHVFGQSGVDLYADGKYVGTAIHNKELEVEHIYFSNAQAQEHEFVLYLPLYNGVSVKAIGVNTEAVIEKPCPFAIPKPVVFYGTSITQGGCASRGGMSYQAILSRMLNIDFVNLGFSGNGRGEKKVALAVAEIDAACFVMDFMANNRTVDSLASVYEPFIRTIREKHPETPIVLVTRIYASRENSLLGGGELIEAKKDIIRNVAAKLITEGDENIMLLEGHALLGPGEGDGLVDGSHPNDLGFQWMAERLAPTLARILYLPFSQG